MISERFDVIFQMQGNGSIVNPMIELFGAKHTAGFCLKDDYCPNRTHYLEYPDGYHEVERHLKLMEFLGIDSRGTDLEFPILQEDYAELRAKGLDLPPGRYVCVHAGSRGGYRQWPPEYFAALADHCAGQDLQVVLTGTSDELPIIEKSDSTYGARTGHRRRKNKPWCGCSFDRKCFRPHLKLYRCFAYCGCT